MNIFPVFHPPKLCYYLKFFIVTYFVFVFHVVTYGGPKVSRQFQLRSRQFQLHHGNFNFVHDNFNFITAISTSSSARVRACGLLAN